MSYQKKLAECRDRIGAIIQENRGIADTAKNEKRNLSDDEIKKVDLNREEFRQLKSDIERFEDLEAQEIFANQSQNPVGHRSHIETPESRNEINTAYSAAFEKYIRSGFRSLEDAEVRSLQIGFVNNDEKRTMSTTTGSQGGYTVPTTLSDKIIKTMDELGAVRGAGIETMKTESGETMYFPTGDDTSNSGELLSQNTEATRDDPEFGQKSLGAYTFSSKIIRVPNQLLRDSKAALENYLVTILGERLARALDGYLTTGTGSSQPEGIVTNSVKGVDAAGTDAVTYDELLDLYFSLVSSYRNNGKFMLHTNTLKTIMKLRDGNDRPYFTASGVNKLPVGLINDAPYVVNDNMAQLGTGNKAIIFGDFKSFWLRDIQNIRLVRLEERYAEYNQTGFIAFSDHDSALMRTDGIKHILQA